MNVRQKTLAALLVLGIGVSGCNNANNSNTIPLTVDKKTDQTTENNRTVVTENNITTTVDKNKTTIVDKNVTITIEGNQTIVKEGNKTTIVDRNLTTESNITIIVDKNGTKVTDGNDTIIVDKNETKVIDGNDTTVITNPSVENNNTEENRTATILGYIGSQHSNHKSTITVAQLREITPALSNIDDRYLNIYQRYIASADTNISSPATIEEVQSMIDDVNAFNLPEHAIVDRSFFKKTNGVFEHRFVYLAVESNTTGRTWLNNNLGAEYANVDSSAYNPSQQATAIKDLLANGSLFQWGRKADGHELIEWSTLSGKYGTTATKSDNPDDSLLITGSDDWRVTSDDTLWASESSPNNVCPVGYRLPLSPNGANDGANEWYQETKDLTQNIGGLFHSFLKVSTTGIRNHNGTASIKFSDGGSSNYWFGSIRSDGKALNMGSNWGVLVASDYGAKIEAHPVRCIKDQTPAERVATILKVIGNEHRNHKSTVTIEELKAITPALNHINDDYENTYRTYIASADKSFSSPATVDELQSMIDEVNRLVPASEATRTLIATQHSNGSSTITVAQLKAINLLNNIQDNNEKWYQSYIEGSDTHFSSPATIEELQSMIDEVNSFNLPDNAILDKNFYKKTNGKFEHRFVYLPVTNSNTGRTWLNNNLGAWYANVGRNMYDPSQQAKNQGDNYAKGSLFQWGRKADGHELVTRWWGNGAIDQLAKTTTKSDNPTDGKYIAVGGDWRVHPNDDLWKGINAPNNPCPAHYRVPTKKELDVEAQTWSDGTMSSLLKIPGPGWIGTNGYTMYYPGGEPRVWVATPVVWKPNGTHSLQRTNGQPVRCIKDQTPTERSDSVLLEIGNEHRNHKSIITIEDLKAITPALNHINDDYENTYRTYIASADKSFSSPATVDELQSMIDEVNRLVPASEATRTLIATQHSNGSSTITVAQLKAIDLLNNVQEANEKFYQSYIEGDTHFSSPATIEELQSMIDEVNSFNLPEHAILDKNFFKKTHNKFEHRFVYLPVTNSNTGRTWLNNNLGAWYANVGRNIYNPSQQATNANDNYAKGSLFQWGRKADGHELVTRWWGNGTIDQLATTTTKSDNPTDGKFIAVNSDWRVHPNDDLWKGINAPNNPCPAHYRVPTKKELDVEAQTWNALSADGSMSSRLKIPGPGWLNSNGYGMFYPGGAPRIWDTTPGVAWRPHETHSLQRTNGLPLRCIKEQTPAERSASVLIEIGNEHNNNKSTVTVAQLKAITPALNHINDDYQDTYRSYIASADKSFSSPATRDEVQSMIDEVNRLVLASEATLADIATQHSNGSSNITVAQLKAIDLLNNVQEANEKFYQSYIEGADTHFSSPATIEELQSMIDEVNALNLPEHAILDRSFFKKTNNKFEHRFVYFPVRSSHSGQIWLNNNLGADYANMNSSVFNPTQKATALNDYKAYGSLFQWGRKADGHELMDWTGATVGAAKYGKTSIKVDDPSHSLFITSNDSNDDWRVTPDDTLWASESSENNVCPVGYRLPRMDSNNQWSDFDNSELYFWWSEDVNADFMSSDLKLPMAGGRKSNGDRAWTANYGIYWTGSPSDSNNYVMSNTRDITYDITRCIDVTDGVVCNDNGVNKSRDVYFSTDRHIRDSFDTTPRVYAFSVRCIKD